MSQGYPQFAAPTAQPPLSDHQLSQLPPPWSPPPWSPQPSSAQPWSPPPGPRPVVEQRPAVVAIAATLAVVAALQFVCVLGLAWVTATAGADQLATTGQEGGLFHILQRFNYRMLDGLAWPLFGFPVASFVTGLLLLVRRSWTRLLHTGLGLAALGWSAFWLRDHLLWWVSAALYVAVACLLLWTPAANRWYGRRPVG